jgi:large subunit ribosomal protein L22e
VIDCTQPVEDHVLDVASFEKYLHDHIKIKGKTQQLEGSNVVISRDRTKLTVASPSELAFSKRQLKYLTKRYLKKQQLKNYLRVVASSKNSYQMRYYNISAKDEAGGDD